MVKIRVPATTANLGPGFDCLGLALANYNEFSFALQDKSLTITGCDAAYANENNLVYRAYAAALAQKDLVPQGLSIHINARIPLARGLGSSAACVVAGILAADALHGFNMSMNEVFSLATALEGHPDNVAPALYGGLNIALMEQGKPLRFPSPVHPAFNFLALVPDFELDTQKARAALPRLVKLTDAVYNVARAALLLLALETGDQEQLLLAAQDRLHQPARLPLIQDGEALMKAARDAGAACFISGAGPSLMCVYTDDNFPAIIEKAMREDFPRFSALPMSVCPQGATIERTNTP